MEDVLLEDRIHGAFRRRRLSGAVYVLAAWIDGELRVVTKEMRPPSDQCVPVYRDGRWYWIERSKLH